MTAIKYICLLLPFFLLSCADTIKTEDKKDSSNSARSQIPRVEVTQAVKRSITDEQVITGSIVPDQATFIHAMENGMVERIFVDIGDEVRKGQVLASLSNPVLRNAYKEAESQVNITRAGIKSAEAKISLAKADNIAAQNIYDVLQTVYAESKGLTTLMEIETAKKESMKSMAIYALAIAEKEVQDAELKSAEIRLNAISERISYLKIKAPFSGIISGRYADAGAIIQNALSDKDANPVLAIESLHPVRLVLPIPETDISGIEKGDLVKINFPSLAGGDIEGKISRIAKSLDPASKTMEVQVDLDNSKKTIKTGMYAKARIQRQSRGDILSLPNASIIMKKDAPFVLIVKDGIVEELQVKKGLSGKDFFEVLSPEINENSLVIVKGKSTVNSGQEVEAIKGIR